MEKIDHLVGYKSITPAEIAFEQYQKFPQYITTIRDGDTVIGYACILALKPDVFHKFREAQITEHDITHDDIDFNTNPVHLLFQSIAIHPKHQNAINAKRLIEKFFAHLRELIDGGMHVAEIITECETKNGMKMATRLLGMKSYRPGAFGQIHTLDGKSFMARMGRK